MTVESKLVQLMSRTCLTLHVQKLHNRTARGRQRANERRQRIEENLTRQQRELASIVEKNKQAMAEHVAALEIMLGDHIVPVSCFISVLRKPMPQRQQQHVANQAVAARHSSPCVQRRITQA